MSNDRFKKNILLLLILVFLLYMGANLLGYVVDQYFRAQFEKHLNFSDDVQGKYALMKRLYPHQSPEVVFIGNSITKENISTATFNRQNINIFNYGLNGYFISQYPRMIENAIKLKPKIIAISMLKEELYRPLSFFYSAYNQDLDIYGRSIYFLAKHAATPAQAEYVKRLVISYLYNLNYFISNGYKISHFLANGYKQAKWNAFFTFPMPDVAINLNCETGMDGIPLKTPCNNGDGILTGQDPNFDSINATQISPLINQNYNYDLLAILNALFDQIKKAGIKPVLIFVPTYEHHIADDALLANTVHAQIIDLSEFSMPKEYWYDGGHYNLRGSPIYSEALAKRMHILLT